MESFIFHEGALPPGYRRSYEVSVFNREEHLRLQSENGWVSFHILDPESKASEAQIHFHVKDGIALSPLKSPFGSFEFSKTVEPKLLYQLIAFAETRLRALHVSKVLIKNPPEYYSRPELTLLNTFLLNQGFHVVNAEVTSIIPVTETSFENYIHPRKRRKLLQSKKGPFHFRIAGVQQLDEVYRFIEVLRSEKKFKLSMSREPLRQTIRTFENEFLLFALYYNDMLAGASVAIKVNRNILYHFMSDYTRRIGEATPGLLLMEGIYDYCRHAQISLLDLGTSALNGQPNFKLLNFKAELGAIPSEKFTFVKDLA